MSLCCFRFLVSCVVFATPRLYFLGHLKSLAIHTLSPQPNALFFSGCGGHAAKFCPIALALSKLLPPVFFFLMLPKEAEKKKSVTFVASSHPSPIAEQGASTGKVFVACWVQTEGAWREHSRSGC